MYASAKLPSHETSMVFRLAMARLRRSSLRLPERVMAAIGWASPWLQERTPEALRKRWKVGAGSTARGLGAAPRTERAPVGRSSVATVSRGLRVKRKFAMKSCGKTRHCYIRSARARTYMEDAARYEVVWKT